jgi:hypothetical protein
MRKIGRNESCHCGSGQKYKRCCLEEDCEQALEQSRKRFINALLEDLFEDDDDATGLMAFNEFFPDIGEKEMRTFWANGREPQTHEPYVLIEFYCTAPKCDCNRVVLALGDGEDMEQGSILSVGFAFDRNDPEPGPYIDPLNTLTPEGKSVYPVIEKMLQSDFEYVARLKRHYDMVKKKIKAEGKTRRLDELIASP